MHPETHKAVTALALERYRAFHPGSWLVSVIEKKGGGRAILDGVVAEDYPTVGRLLNWHFFASNRVIAAQSRSLLPGLVLRPTSEHIVASRAGTLIDRAGRWPDRSQLKTLGRLLHHIQDMSIPAHVVPIYHGPAKKDAFELYLQNNWPHIAAGLRAEPFTRREKSDARDCRDLPSLYRLAGARLLRTLQGSGGLFPLVLDRSLPPVPSSAFWQPYDRANGRAETVLKIKGFGSFGPLGESFGAIERFTLAGVEYRLPPGGAPYLAIALFFMKCAVQDSLAGLALFDGLLATVAEERRAPAPLTEAWPAGSAASPRG